MKNARRSKEGVTGIPSGLKSLDRLTTGFRESDLILIAAHASQGKTALALNIAANAVLSKKPTPVLLFSPDMDSRRVMQRLVAAYARVSLSGLRKGVFDRNRCGEVAAAAGRISSAPLHIDDTAPLKVADLLSRSGKLAAELRGRGNELGLIVVDYLQALRGTGRPESRRQEIADITRGLKGLAKELDLPVIACCAMDLRVRCPGQDFTARPQLSDMRSSPALTEEPDLILLIHRPSHYRPHAPEVDTRKAEVIVAKQRHGPLGVAEVAFLREFALFEDAHK